MPFREKLRRFVRKIPSDQWAAIKATVRSAIMGRDPAALERERREALLAGPHAPPAVLRANEPLYVAYRPDSDWAFASYPEITELSEKWIAFDQANNSGDLPRLYALVLNARQIISEEIPGDMAELGVFRGNSAAVLAHYARKSAKNLWLFDTFQGFDQRDLVAGDQQRPVEFENTSLGLVREVVGEENVQFVRGWFPQSVPEHLNTSEFCLVHIDCDLYEPAKAGLEFFCPRLAPGGLLIVHDYANPSWNGVRRAVDEYFSGAAERPVIFGDKSGTAMLRKAVKNYTASGA